MVSSEEENVEYDSVILTIYCLSYEFVLMTRISLVCTVHCISYTLCTLTDLYSQYICIHTHTYIHTYIHTLYICTYIHLAEFSLV